MEKQRVVYLDNAATTPISNEAYREMIEAYGNVYGNPSSLYKAGREAEALLSKAREKVAKAIGALPSEIYFTSGGSEANNWAITGIAKANRNKGNHIITSTIEHPSVLETCKMLESEGFRVTYIPVDEFGVVKYSEIVKSIGPDTILISIMTANNEVGSIQPVKAISELAKANEVIFHTDAAQAIGAIDLRVKDIGIDALSISAHKFNGPKGVGCLYIKNGIKIQKFINGGNQENNLRAGTENVPAIVGMGKAIEEATANIEENNKYLRSLRRYFLKQASASIHNIALNGHPIQRLANNVNLSFEGADSEAVLLMLDREGVYASASSACATGSSKPSHVLTAMGKDIETARSSIRFTFSKVTTKEDIDYVVERVRRCVKRIRSISAIRIYKNKVEL